MGTVITNLKARFGIETSDFRKGLKDGEKATSDFKGAAGSILDEFASMFGVNMRTVNDAIGTANKSLSFLGSSFKGAAKGGDILSISLKVLKFALISTGIGALIVLLGSLIAYFTKTGEGTDKFAKILMQVKSVVNNVIDRLAVFGKGLWELMTGKFKQGWEDMTGAFKGMGTEIVEDWKAAGDLADRFEALEDREIALINSLEERKAKAAELRLLAKEEQEDQKKKLDLLNQAEKLYKSVYGDQISLEKERLALMKEKLALQTSDPTDEQRRGVAEQEAKINGLLREQAEELKGLYREKKKSIEAVTKELELEKAKAAQIKTFAADVSNIKLPDLSAFLKGMEKIGNLKDLKLPDFSKLLTDLEKVAEKTKNIKEIIAKASESLNSAVKDAMEELALNTGIFLGNLLLGKGGFNDFASVVGAAFAGLAVIIGQIMIKAAIGLAAVSLALKMPGSWPVLLAAGVALVAIGTALKGSLAAAASGGGSGGSSGSSGNFNYDTRITGPAKIQPIEIHLTGKLVGEGSSLVSVIEYEYRRKKVTT